MLNRCLHATYAYMLNMIYAYLRTRCLYAKYMPTCYVCQHTEYNICLHKIYAHMLNEINMNNMNMNKKNTKILKYEIYDYKSALKL